MLRKILVATDLTAGSEHAVTLGLDLGRRYRAEVHLLHVIESAPPSRASDELLREVVRAEERASLQILRDSLGGRDHEVSTRVWVRHGSPAEVVVGTAAELGVDLVVVGTHARTGLARVLVGSVAERIGRQAACPVLLARPPAA
jgi:nucleotide-binding universal stress UspA family protein